MDGSLVAIELRLPAVSLSIFVFRLIQAGSELTAGNHWNRRSCQV